MSMSKITKCEDSVLQKFCDIVNSNYIGIHQLAGLMLVLWYCHTYVRRVHALMTISLPGFSNWVSFKGVWICFSAEWNSSGTLVRVPQISLLLWNRTDIPPDDLGSRPEALCKYICIYIYMYFPYTSSVIGRIYNGIVIQYWRSCTPSRSIGECAVPGLNAILCFLWFTNCVLLFDKNLQLGCLWHLVFV